MCCQEKLTKDDLKNLNQEFDNNVLDLVKQKGFHPYDCMTDFKKFNNNYQAKNIYSSLTGKKFSNKGYHHVYKAWNKFEMKTMKDYHDSYLKCDVLLLQMFFQNLEIKA